MKLVLKQHGFVTLDTRQFINATAVLQFDTDALCVVTLNLYDIKVP